MGRGRAAEPLRTAVIPIWRRPWMHVGSDTFTGDVLAHLGVINVLADHAERYPKIALADLPPSELVVLPDEPYLFTAEDGPEAFPDRDAVLVSGRLLTWYGPSLVEAPARAARARSARRRPQGELADRAEGHAELGRLVRRAHRSRRAGRSPLVANSQWLSGDQTNRPSW